MSGEFCGEGCPSDQFKLAMRCVAASVHVITTVAWGKRWGLTATAVHSLSSDPPTMTVCVNRAAEAYGPLLQSRRVGINVLAESQCEIARQFSGFRGHKGEDRFRGWDWIDGHGVPLLRNAVAALDCDLVNAFEHASHALLICRVARIELNPKLRPLLYHNRAYAMLGSLAEDLVSPPA